jgi:D-alanyl-D-alanine dipeptidase
VDNFVKWGGNLTDTLAKDLYYPTLEKKDVFAQGYIATKSSHTRGNAVDVSIIKLQENIHEIKVSSTTLKNGEVLPVLDDGTLYMQTSFDLFHQASHHDSFLVDELATENRNLLRNVMAKHGFIHAYNEWWHYNFNVEIYPETYFNFLIE